jgi:glucuronosyltransferase
VFIYLFSQIERSHFVGHSAIRLFITHGGFLGMQEALYHSVPLLALPFGTDQYLNSAKVRKEGCGLHLDWDNLDEATLFTSITSMINNSR